MYEELVKQLKRQIKYLETSSEAYDNGDIDEAIRIATVFRILFHDTKESTSLFRHLKQKNTFSYISTLESIEERKNRFLKEEGILIQDNNPPIMFVDGERKPPFDTWGIKKFLPFDSWWNEKILKIDNHEYSRRDIVLFSANKDGGAHVAPKINNNAKLLKEGTGQIIFEAGYSDTGETELRDNHFLFLRQFAYEVLSMEEIFTKNGLVFRKPKSEIITYNGFLKKADTLIDKENFEEAKKILIEAKEYNPFRKEAYNGLGYTYEYLYDENEAIRYYHKALDIDKTFLKPYLNLSNIYYRHRKYKEVMDLCNIILEINPDMQKAKDVYNMAFQEFKKQVKNLKFSSFPLS